MPDAARVALEGWWESLAPSPLVEALRTQPDAESVSMHDLRALMDYLLHRTDEIPGCAQDACIAPAAALNPLRETLRLLTQVTARINPVQLLTPDQVTEERLEFQKALAKNRPYNPRFTYRHAVGTLRASLEKTPGLRQEHTWEGLIGTLEGFHRAVTHLETHMDHPVLDVLVPLLHAKVDDDLGALRLARALEEEREEAVAEALGQLYHAPGVEDVGAATSLSEVLRAHPSLIPWSRELPEDAPTLLQELVAKESASPQHLEDAINRSLRMYYDHVSQAWDKPLPSSLRYDVRVDPLYVNFDVRDKSSTGPVIGIPPRPRTWLGVLALCRHEIDMHVRQSLNGALLYGLGGGMLKHNQEDLYEGVALYAERQFTAEVLGIAQTPCLPYATLVYQDALRGATFHEAFCRQIDRFPKTLSITQLRERSWNIVYRIYRGRLDTGAGLAYGCAKDTGYLRGAVVTRQLHQAGLAHLLDYGIVPLELLPLHRRLRRDLPLPYPDLNTAEVLLHHYFPQLPHGR